MVKKEDIMKEYKIIWGNPAECQTKLNQWRHEYNIWILEMCSHNDTIAILLTREKVEDEDAL